MHAKKSSSLAQIQKVCLKLAIENHIKRGELTSKQRSRLLYAGLLGFAVSAPPMYCHTKDAAFTLMFLSICISAASLLLMSCLMDDNLKHQIRRLRMEGRPMQAFFANKEKGAAMEPNDNTEESLSSWCLP